MEHRCLRPPRYCCYYYRQTRQTRHTGRQTGRQAATQTDRPECCKWVNSLELDLENLLQEFNILIQVSAKDIGTFSNENFTSPTPSPTPSPTYLLKRWSWSYQWLGISERWPLKRITRHFPTFPYLVCVIEQIADSGSEVPAIFLIWNSTARHQLSYQDMLAFIFGLCTLAVAEWKYSWA
jgi:hypothetical protein